MTDTQKMDERQILRCILFPTYYASFAVGMKELPQHYRDLSKYVRGGPGNFWGHVDKDKLTPEVIGEAASRLLSLYQDDLMMGKGVIMGEQGYWATMMTDVPRIFGEYFYLVRGGGIAILKMRG